MDNIYSALSQDVSACVSAVVSGEQIDLLRCRTTPSHSTMCGMPLSSLSPPQHPTLQSVQYLRETVSLWR